MQAYLLQLDNLLTTVTNSAGNNIATQGKTEVQSVPSLGYI